ncbi:hypothetical protein HPB52_020080 [Rhipicephalus sanguineus]|uniref:Uncharacterized protein n=1 Tax=Rhipicephalus sanguineus TaxID=34632 RepID=A0A9D4Q2H3_RHISA|nr:hypothetical protein HPB52_020080 [Rhipicephalus sanguineus]
MHGYDTGDPGCMGVLPLGVGGHYLCPDDGLGARPANLSSHHSSHLPGTPSELSSPRANDLRGPPRGVVQGRESTTARRGLKRRAPPTETSAHAGALYIYAAAKP